VAAVLTAAVLLGACSAQAGRAPAATSSPAATSAAATASGDTGAPPQHVVVAVFENKDAGHVSADDAPFLTSLAAQGLAFTDAHGETHPSQPNYLALFSGSTQGVTDDSCPQSFRGDNLAAQLRAAGRTFTGYSEGLPGAGYTGCGSGRYARKHNPWADFPALPASVNQPLAALPGDWADLPTVAVVVPDLCDDMHDCSVSTGDTWAREHLGTYAGWARTHDSLLVVTFDEDEGTSANHIATFVVGAGVRPGVSGVRIDHYGILRTIEDLYGLPPLGHAAGATHLPGVGSTA
jgi:acid phosphatase